METNTKHKRKTNVKLVRFTDINDYVEGENITFRAEYKVIEETDSHYFIEDDNYNISKYSKDRFEIVEPSKSQSNNLKDDFAGLKNNYKKHLESNIKMLIKELQEELKMLSTDDDYCSNSYGIIQGRAIAINSYCAKLSALKDAVKML